MAKLDPTALSDDALIEAIIAAEKKSVKAKEVLVAELLRRSKIDDGAYYAYTYKLPFSKRTTLDHWRGANNEEIRKLAFAKYKTSDFFIELSSRQEYLLFKYREAVVAAFPQESS